MPRAQESVWDYPRPPRLEKSDDPIEIEAGGRLIARTTRSYRCLETSHPPVYYLPPDAFAADVLQPARDGRGSWCEFKGPARYFDMLVDGGRIDRAAWRYPDPTPAFAPIRDWIAVYPSKMDACRVAGESVAPQEGDFYGGWITSWIAGPFKGGPGTMGW
ncbi:MAG: DUF427 domain-containing protein [Marivibrio sp.]|uniref:DUF427 domain-containing protein n=1 Tax=Marivibrio sp. TaxID=2039719 RepID=UPI0032F03EB4